MKSPLLTGKHLFASKPGNYNPDVSTKCLYQTQLSSLSPSRNTKGGKICNNIAAMMMMKVNSNDNDYVVVVVDDDKHDEDVDHVYHDQ